MVGSALGFGGDVVGLEPVAGRASGNGAHTAVAVEDEPSQLRWDGPCGRPDRERDTVRGCHQDFDLAIAEDLFQRERPYPGSGSDLGSGFPSALGGLVGVHEDRHQRGRGVCFGWGFVGWGSEGVLGDGD